MTMYSIGASCKMNKDFRESSRKIIVLIPCFTDGKHVFFFYISGGIFCRDLPTVFLYKLYGASKVIISLFCRFLNDPQAMNRQTTNLRGKMLLAQSETVP